MPLLDHFRQPHSEDLPWTSFSTMWVAAVTGELNRALPRPRFRALAVRPDLSMAEVRIIDRRDSRREVAAVRFVSPENKRDASARAAFLTRNQSLLEQCVGLVVIDVVTEPATNLHDEFVLQHGYEHPPLTGPISCVSYRATQHGGHNQIETWALPLELGQQLPAMPLPLLKSIMIPLDLDATYERALKQSGA